MYPKENTPLPKLHTTSSQVEIIDSLNNIIEFLNSQNFPNPGLELKK